MKKTEFTLIIAFMLLAFSITVLAQESKKPYLVKEFELNGGGNLITKTSGGSIKVTGSGKKNVTVKMYVTPANWKDRDEAPSKEALGKYTFSVRQENNTIYAIAQRKDNSWDKNTALNVSFEIEVPQQTATKLNTSGGSISLTNLTGLQEARTSGGSLNFSDIKGNTVATTSGGSITFSDYTGKLDASTSGGSINLTNASGTLKLNTSGGSIRLKQVAGDINAQTSGGSIYAEVEKLGKYLTLATSGGSVHATVPKGLGLDLDLSGNRVKTAVTNFSGTAKDNRVKGSINGGGIPVKLSTSGGTTELNYRM